MKTKMLADFQICISVPLKHAFKEVHWPIKSKTVSLHFYWKWVPSQMIFNDFTKSKTFFILLRLRNSLFWKTYLGGCFYAASVCDFKNTFLKDHFWGSACIFPNLFLSNYKAENGCERVHVRYSSQLLAVIELEHKSVRKIYSNLRNTLFEQQLSGAACMFYIIMKNVIGVYLQ